MGVDVGRWGTGDGDRIGDDRKVSFTMDEKRIMTGMNQIKSSKSMRSDHIFDSIHYAIHEVKLS